MAVLEMKRIEICSLKKNRKLLLEDLQRKGVIEITNFKKISPSLESLDTSKSRAIFEKNIAISKQALSTLDRHTGMSSSVSSIKGKDTVSVANYYEFVNNSDEIIRVVNRINALDREISESNAEIIRAQTQIETLTPWKDLDVSMSFSGTKTTKAFIGTIPEELSLSVILSGIASKAPKLKNVYVEIVSSSKEQTCLFVVCKREDYEVLENVLKQMGFAKPSLQANTNPQEKIIRLSEIIEKEKSEIEKKKKEIKSYVGVRNAIRFIIDYYSMRKDKYKIIDQLGNTKKTFFMYGYVTAENADDVAAYVEANYDAQATVFDLTENEVPPVLLKNNAFAAPVETVVESYSLPGKGEIDPTSIMAIFYYVLFGLMFSDAGYGILMTVVCGYALKKFKNMELSMKKSATMFLYCGLSTTFWGFMFGSFFGDAVNVVSKTFFSGPDDLIKPIWFFPDKEPMKMLAFSFGIGVLHIFTGLGIKFFQLCKEKKFKDAVCDVVLWYLLVGGAIVYLLTIPMFSEMLSLGDLSLPPVVAKISEICMAVGAVGIVLTSGRDSKNPFKRFLKGLYGLYNVSGYLSDILSYSRLLALGLSTGVIASVFNKMGTMAGPGVIQFILFCFIFFIGHSINIGINLLGAYVHTNRLQFVEFFGKFYEGGGRKFSPFSVKTKYYKFQEEINNG